MLAGSAALVAGATRLERSGETGQYALASTAVGTLAVVAAINTLRARQSDPPASRAGSRSVAGLSDLTITPDVGWPGGATRAGVTLSARF